MAAAALAMLAALLPGAQVRAAWSVWLPVPLVQQNMTLDCESAALQGALAGIGISADQRWIYSQLPVDPRPPIVRNGWPVVWGNPYEAFVGNVWGSEPGLTGYGVYYPPIANVARLAGAEVVAHGGWTFNELIDQLNAGHPVEVWLPHNLQPVNVGTMQTWDGQTVWFAEGEHAQVLMGYDWNAGTVAVMDVEDGRYKTFSFDAFMASFNQFHAEAVAVMNEFSAPATPPPLPVLSRYWTAAQGNWVDTGPVTDAFVTGTFGSQQNPLGELDASPAAGEVPLFSCVNGNDHFVSLQAGCEGAARLRTMGYIATSRSPDHPVALFRCQDNQSGHFVSQSPTCDRVRLVGRMEALGFARALVPLLEYTGPRGHWDATGGAPSGQAYFLTVGWISATPGSGLVPLYACRAGVTSFSSRDPGCEGQRLLGTVGWVNASSAFGETALYRCVSAGWDHFDSLDPGCGGAQRETVLGWVHASVGRAGG